MARGNDQRRKRVLQDESSLGRRALVLAITRGKPTANCRKAIAVPGEDGQTDMLTTDGEQGVVFVRSQLHVFLQALLERKSPPQ